MAEPLVHDPMDEVNALCGEFGCVAGEVRIDWLRRQLEIAAGHDRRVTELLAVNNRYLQEARDARKKAKQAEADANMYAQAWERELRPFRISGKRHHIDAMVQATQDVVKKALRSVILEARTAGKRRGVYVASKTRHAPVWKIIRAAGLPIISTWIDEAGPGESSDLNDLWERCIREASTAKVLILYREADDVLKGGWVELGAALACGVTVYAVGISDFTIARDRRITHFGTLDVAVDAARELVAKEKGDD